MAPLVGSLVARVEVNFPAETRLGVGRGRRGLGTRAGVWSGARLTPMCVSNERIPIGPRSVLRVPQDRVTASLGGEDRSGVEVGGASPGEEEGPFRAGARVAQRQPLGSRVRGGEGAGGGALPSGRVAWEVPRGRAGGLGWGAGAGADARGGRGDRAAARAFQAHLILVDDVGFSSAPSPEPVGGKTLPQRWRPREARLRAGSESDVNPCPDAVSVGVAAPGSGWP